MLFIRLKCKYFIRSDQIILCLVRFSLIVCARTSTLTYHMRCMHRGRSAYRAFYMIFSGLFSAYKIYIIILSIYYYRIWFICSPFNAGNRILGSLNAFSPFSSYCYTSRSERRQCEKNRKKNKTEYESPGEYGHTLQSKHTLERSKARSASGVCRWYELQPQESAQHALTSNNMKIIELYDRNYAQLKL